MLLDLYFYPLHLHAETIPKSSSVDASFDALLIRSSTEVWFNTAVANIKLTSSTNAHISIVRSP